MTMTSSPDPRAMPRAPHRVSGAGDRILTDVDAAKAYVALMKRVNDLEERLAAVEEIITRPISGRNRVNDMLYDAVHEFLTNNAGVRFTSGSITDNISSMDIPGMSKIEPRRLGNLTRTRVEWLVDAGLAKKLKVKGRDTTFWVERHAEKDERQ